MATDVEVRADAVRALLAETAPRTIVGVDIDPHRGEPGVWVIPAVGDERLAYRALRLMEVRFGPTHGDEKPRCFDCWMDRVPPGTCEHPVED